jgi:hypothetical protein
MQRNHVLITALLSAAGAATAADFAPEGKYDFTSCWSGISNTIAFSKAHVAFSYEMTGSSRASSPGGFYDKTAFHCVGMNTSIDGNVSGVAVCEAMDKDGDKTLTRFEASGGRTVRMQLAGTGKYEGALIAGSVETLGPFPTIKPGTFQNCNHQTGTYKLPKLMK